MSATPTSNLAFQNFYSATLTADITASSTDIFLDTVPTGTEGFLVIEPDSSTAREIIYYNTKTATKVTCPSVADGRGQDSTTAGAHLTGSTVIMAPIAAMFNALRTLFTTSPQGWTALAGTFTSPVANGNRNYTVTTSTDQRAVLSPGHRLRLTRTVTAPTQCTSLNGTTQYYSKAAPAGMTFTNFPVVSAWIKLASYNGAVNSIASRYNGTSGWEFQLNSSGQIALVGRNAAAANFNQVISYQSVPLNKWVHVAAQLDMSTATLDATHSYIMIDGVNIPASKSTGGTAPTALIQAGNLEIGSENGGLLPFNGKIAQVAIYSAAVTQATIQASISQTLAGTETSLISAYSFNNTINDLNTTNANNLTANGSAVATSADSPFAQGATAVSGFTAGVEEFGIVAAVTASTINFNVPEGSAIPTSGGITSAYYSTYKMPYGFPGQDGKFDIQLILLTNVGTSGVVTNTIYNPGGLNLNVPIGAWLLDSDLGFTVTNSTTTSSVYLGISTSSSSFSDVEMTSRQFSNGFSTAPLVVGTMQFRKPVNVSVATPYYALLCSSAAFGTAQFRGDNSAGVGEHTKITAKNAYL